MPDKKTTVSTGNQQAVINPGLQTGHMSGKQRTADQAKPPVQPAGKKGDLGYQYDALAGGWLLVLSSPRTKVSRVRITASTKGSDR